ncbi:MAG: phospholipase D family protein [Cocleimonas sp.]|nr:phospholipase D family protein [Cocleimonas sp.]
MAQSSHHHLRLLTYCPHVKTASLLILSVYLSACTVMPADSSLRKPSFALQQVSHTRLAKAYQHQINQHHGKSGFVLLGSGLDAFAARKELFEKAEKSIDVQYFLVRDDLTGHLFYTSLKKAADRGVRVRILLDDHHLLKQTAKLAALDRHPNIEVRVFNPYSRHAPRFIQYAFQLNNITRRMHNKSVTIDNKITIMGSRNIGNEYSEAEAERVFSGMEVLAIGTIVENVSDSFDQYWNYRRTIKVSQLAQPARINEQQEKKRYQKDPMTERFVHTLKTSPLVQQIKNNSLPFQWAHAQLIKDPPNKITQPKVEEGRYLNATGFEPFIQDTQRDLLIITPYFIATKEGLKFFQNILDRGLNVSVLTNSYASTDMKIVNAHYNRYRKKLLKMGVKIYEFKAVRGSVNLLQQARDLVSPPAKAGLHAKILSFDKEHLYIGSMNMDPRSIYQNTELGIMISSPEITQSITSWFDKNLDDLAYHVELRNNKVIWIDYSHQQKMKAVDNVIDWFNRHVKDEHDAPVGDGFFEPSQTNFPKLLTTEPDTTMNQRAWMNVMAMIPIENQL